MGIMTNGVQQWAFQRVSNAVFIVFGIILLAVLLNGGFSYDTLTGMLSNTGFKIYLGVTLIFACANSILAGWQITGDYAHKFNISPYTMMGLAVIVSLAYLIFGFFLLL